jgi:hypothetical protein
VDIPAFELPAELADAATIGIIYDETDGLNFYNEYAATDAGKLQYRPGPTHGNPWPRLLHRKAEELTADPAR